MVWSSAYKLHSVGDTTAPRCTPARIGQILEISEPDLTAKSVRSNKNSEESSTMEVRPF